MNCNNTHKRSTTSQFTTPTHTLFSNYRQQAGATLIVSLMMLVVLTLLGLSGMQSTIMQERMSNNVRDKGMAFQATESAVRIGEGWVSAQDISKIDPQTCSGSPCNVVNLNNYANMTDQNFVWWQANGREFAGMPSGVLAANPRFIVEQHSAQRASLLPGTTYSTPPVRTLFRLTSAGVGGTITAAAMIETLYARID